MNRELNNLKLEIATILADHKKSVSDIRKMYVEVVNVDGISHREYTAYEAIPADLDYDDGYGERHVFGMILLNNGDWLERGEYDGSEWWNYRTPVTPEYMDKLINGY